MAATGNYAWKSDAVWATVLIVFWSISLAALGAVLPHPSGTAFRMAPGVVVMAPFWIMSNSAVPTRDRKIGGWAVVPPAFVVLAVADQIRSLSSQPGWAYVLSYALAAWVGCLGAIWFTWLRIKRRRTQELAGGEPAETPPPQ
ncbi:hypothetical protein [Dactylosporangium sp. CA-092794]|uniref:hypothetical protein n=1 Tax=Dactylosporangium sp. CA-092794 TaxID=3239929 RepID=UPI003D8C3FAF